MKVAEDRLLAFELAFEQNTSGENRSALHQAQPSLLEKVHIEEGSKRLTCLGLRKVRRRDYSSTNLRSKEDRNGAFTE